MAIFAILALNVLLSAASHAGEAVSVSFSVQAVQIQDAVAARLSAKAQWALVASDLGTGERLMEAGSAAKDPLIPASLMKLFVTAAILDKNGREAIDLSTAIAMSGNVSKGTLRGDVIIKGAGDPFLSGKDLLQGIEKIKSVGVKEIDGDIIVDDSLFDTKNWKNRHTGPAYAVPSALGLDMHTVSITADGKSKRVLIDPPNDAVKVSFNPSGKPGIRQIDDVTYEVTGATLDAPAIHKRFSLAEPGLYAGGTFLTLLKKAGIKVAGVVKRGTASQNGEKNQNVFRHGSTRMDTDWDQEAANLAFIRVDQCASVADKLVVALTSSELEEKLDARETSKIREIARIGTIDINRMISDTNQHSLNVAADNLLFLLGAKTYGVPGTREKGIQAVNGFLTDMGVPVTGMVIDDGSGVSERNRVSSEQMVSFLRAAVRKPWFGTFFDSLSRPGMDGRLKDFGYKSDRIRAKSGQLRDAYCLAGYVDRVDGKKIAFAYMVNGSGSDIQAASSAAPEVLKYLEN